MSAPTITPRLTAVGTAKWRIGAYHRGMLAVICGAPALVHRARPPRPRARAPPCVDFTFYKSRTQPGAALGRGRLDAARAAGRLEEQPTACRRRRVHASGVRALLRRPLPVWLDARSTSRLGPGLRPVEPGPDGLADAGREGREQDDGHQEGDEAELRSWKRRTRVAFYQAPR